MGNPVSQKGWLVAACAEIGISVVSVLAEVSSAGLGETLQTTVLLNYCNSAGPQCLGTAPAYV